LAIYDNVKNAFYLSVCLIVQTICPDNIKSSALEQWWSW